MNTDNRRFLFDGENPDAGQVYITETQKDIRVLMAFCLIKYGMDQCG